MSEEKKSLVKALVAFQKEVPAIPKNKVNPFFNSKYAELSTVIDTCVPVLTKYGLAVSQSMNVFAVAGRNVLVTKLMHESGAQEDSSLLLPEIADAQKLTAAITYLRRAQYLAIVGLVAEDDNDGNALTDKKQEGGNNNQQRQQQNTGNDLKKASGAQLGALKKLLPPDHEIFLVEADTITAKVASELIAAHQPKKG